MSLLEEAMAEAYASAPAETVVLYTVEIWHESLTEPIRVVRWPQPGPEPEQFHLKLEDDADRDAGETVTFLGCPFEEKLPERGQDSPGQFELTIPAAGPLIEPYLENAALDGGPIEATFRTYVKGREDEGPVEVWPGIIMRSPSVDASSGNVTVQGSVLDWLNRKYGRNITPGNYPALVGR